MKRAPLILTLTFAGLTAQAAPTPAQKLPSSAPQTAVQSPEAPSPNVRYKKGKDVNFEELLIQGQIKRPEITVVTGDDSQGTDGLLRLRENFVDRMTMDFGEEIK